MTEIPTKHPRGLDEPYCDSVRSLRRSGESTLNLRPFWEKWSKVLQKSSTASQRPQETGGAVSRQEECSSLSSVQGANLPPIHHRPHGRDTRTTASRAQNQHQALRRRYAHHTTSPLAKDTHSRPPPSHTPHKHRHSRGSLVASLTHPTNARAGCPPDVMEESLREVCHRCRPPHTLSPPPRLSTPRAHHHFQPPSSSSRRYSKSMAE